MKFRSQYLWAYLLVAGFIMLFSPKLPVIGGDISVEGAPETARLLSILSLFSVPVLIIGSILAFVQFIQAGIRRPAPPATPQVSAATPQVSDVTSADSPAPVRNTMGTTGIITMIVGVVIAFLPLIIASVSTSPGHNMWNESDSSSATAALFLLVITIPVGGITAIVGLVLTIVSVTRKNVSR